MSGPFKMKGWSPFTKTKDHPKKESPPEHKDLHVLPGDASDIEDRIEFLQNDIQEGKISVMEGGKKITELKKALTKSKKN